MERSPVKVQKAWEFVDLDTGTESGEVDGIDGLFHQGEVVPDEAGHEDVLLIVTTEDALEILILHFANGWFLLFTKSLLDDNCLEA